MATLRTKEKEEEYQQYVREGNLANGCKLCDKQGFRTFNHWKIVANDFPYDRIAKTHDMIVSIRHVGEDGLSREELEEFKKIKEEHIFATYEYIVEPVHKKKSIPGH